jgi:HSP20 family protein
MGKLNQDDWMGVNGFDKGTAREGTGCGPAWTPAADVLEDEDGFTILVELPGLTLDDVTVELRDGRLLVYGKRPGTKRPGDTRYHVVERPRGTFARGFTLSRNVRPEDIRATLKHGLLTITLKKAGPRRRSIPIG